MSQSGAYGGLFFREVRAARARGRQVPLDRESVRPRVHGVPRLACRRSRHARGGALRRGNPGRPGLRRGRPAARRARSRSSPSRAVGPRRGGGPPGSHTGSLAGAWETYRAAFAAAGIVVVEETEELFDAMVTLEAHGSRPPRDAAVAILTISGGPSVVAADAAEAAGLRVPALPEERRRALRAHLPDFGADGNPVDMTPQMEPAGFEPSVRLVLEAPEVSGAIAIDIGLDRPEYADALVAAQAATGKPVVACTVDTPDMDRRLRAAGIPLVPGPERAVRAYRALVRHASLRRRGETVPVRRPPPALPAGLVARLATARGPLGHADARALLEAYGVPFPRERIVATAEEALSAAGGDRLPSGGQDGATGRAPPDGGGRRHPGRGGRERADPGGARARGAGRPGAAPGAGGGASGTRAPRRRPARPELRAHGAGRSRRRAGRAPPRRVDRARAARARDGARDARRGAAGGAPPGVSRGRGRRRARAGRRPRRGRGPSRWTTRPSSSWT